MALFKKLKTLLKKEETEKPQAHLSPISERIEAWLNGHGWKYEHVLPEDDDELRTHHFLMGFRDENNYLWNCLIRVHEKNQLISFQGMPELEIEKKYYLPILAMLSAINCTIGIGNMELDVSRGMIQTKLGVDGEFTNLSDHALNSYLQGIASLTEKAYDLVSVILKDPNPEQDLLQLLRSQGAFGEEDEIETDSAGNPYFVPTHTAQ